MAVGAPGAADGYDDNLAVKLRVGVGDELAFEIGEAEGEGLGGILDGGLLGGLGGRGEVLLAGVGRASCGEVLLLGFLGFGGEEVRDDQRAVGLRGEGIEGGAGGGEVGDGVVLAVPGAEEGAGVAVDALDDGVDGGESCDGVDAELPADSPLALFT